MKASALGDGEGGRLSWGKSTAFSMSVALKSLDDADPSPRWDLCVVVAMDKFAWTILSPVEEKGQHGQSLKGRAHQPWP